MIDLQRSVTSDLYPSQGRAKTAPPSVHFRLTVI